MMLFYEWILNVKNQVRAFYFTASQHVYSSAPQNKHLDLQLVQLLLTLAYLAILLIKLAFHSIN